MEMWKGAFAPFRKHHGGSLEDHVELQVSPHLPEGYKIDVHPDKSRHLLVAFSLDRWPIDTTVYRADIKLEPSENPVDEKGVREIVSAELNKPASQRRWSLPDEVEWSGDDE